MKNNVHVQFDGQNIFFPPEIAPVFEFLIKIEKEVNSVLNYAKKLKDIKEQYSEVLKLATLQAKKLIENNIDYEFKFSQDTKTITEKLSFKLPVRSQMIVLFANLETLRTLWTAYELETHNKTNLRNASDEAIDKFIRKFCLTKENNWVKNNRNRSGKIGVKSLRNLRNALTHFFSVSKLGIVPSYDDKAKKISNKTNHKVQFISPTDLYEIIKGAGILMLTQWSNDYLSDPIKFKKGIHHVQSIVEKTGARIVPHTIIDL